ncbi:hypothetical protein ACEQPO_08820 [Bacillus sp. SL00103]
MLGICIVHRSFLHLREVMVSSFNQSMDSLDQSGIASLVEEILKWLCAKFSYGDQADGTFTSGGTQSNYMGLLLARDAFCEKHMAVECSAERLTK